MIFVVHGFAPLRLSELSGLGPPKMTKAEVWKNQMNWAVGRKLSVDLQCLFDQTESNSIK